MNAVAAAPLPPDNISTVRSVSHESSVTGNSQIDAGDSGQFRAALERQMRAPAPTAQQDSNKVSLGDKMMTRTTDLATELKKDQQYVSKLLEQATRSADSMHLMKAMMALNDYQMRVQFVSKTVSKATSALDQLTKLQ